MMIKEVFAGMGALIGFGVGCLFGFLGGIITSIAIILFNKEGNRKDGE